MLRPFALAAGLLALVSATLADDAITPDVVRATKQAAVYIDVDGEDWGASGSGFVVSADNGTVLVATNHHVAVKRPAGVRSTKPPALKVVFDSGTKTERSYPAEVVASDADRDLAVLKVAGVKDAPKPIPYANPPEPVETMTVHPFGFPLGQRLSTGKGYPAVTVGKASVSSLRNGADGELETIQIDGNLNPGNSGGPVVDGKGRLVGVAVAIARDGQGIGFIIPAAEVVKTMDGRLGRVRVLPRKGADGKPAVRVEAEVIDPTGAFRGATAHYVVVPPKGKRPDAAALDKHPDAKKLVLKVERGVGAVEFPVEKAEGEVVVQVTADRGAGKAALATQVRGFSLSSGPKPEDLAGPPPSGWKDYSPKDKSFALWLPEKPARQEEKQRNVPVDRQVMRVSSVVGKTADGLGYLAEYVALPPALATQTPVRLHSLMRTILLDEGKGRFTESVRTQAGSLSGVQYRIEFGDEVARARVFITPRGGLVRLVRVAGTADQVTSAEAETILQSFRLPGDQLAFKTPEPPAGGTDLKPLPRAEPKPVYSGPEPHIFGTIRDKRFKSAGPAGAVLVGLEAKFTKFGDRDIVRAVRPVYRVNGKEETGPLTGADLTGAVALRAKDGYAVGGMAAKSDWWCHGFSLTYMKVKPDGTLDPKDSYESDWVGWDGKVEVRRVTGDGTPAVGLVGKIAGRDTTCLGLLFKGQEGFDPDATPRADQHPPQPPQRVIPPGKEPTIIAGSRNPVFKDLAPEGGLLVGLELALGKFAGQDVIKAARPLYRVGEKDAPGEFRGTSRDRLTVIKAKAGYAVGALSCKYGLNFDGVSLTFMKVRADGTLDPKDAYESDWVGWAGNKPVTKLGGDGTAVVGVVGRANTDLNGFGLLFKGQEGFDPATKR